MKTIRNLVVLLCLTWASARGATVQFAPNHLFVSAVDTNTSLTSVFEFDSAMNLLRVIPIANNNGKAYGLTFDPDGNLWVALASHSQIVKVTPALATNTVLDSSNGLAFPDALSFGPDGTLYAPNRSLHHIVTFKTDGTVGSITFSNAAFAPSAVSYGVAGNRYISGGGSAGIHEQDPSGRDVQIFGTTALGSCCPANVLQGPGDTLYVADCGGRIQVFDVNGNLQTSITNAALSCAYGIAFGPNGNLFVSSWSNNSIVEFTPAGQLVRITKIPRMLTPAYLAFAPHRCAVTLTGSLAMTTTNAAKLVQRSAVLSLTPGSRTIMLSLPDSIGNPADYASLFGGIWHLFRGFENFNNAHSTTRLYYGTQVSDPPTVAGLGTVSLTIKGAVDTNGWFMIKSVAGKLLRSTDGAQFDSTLTGNLIK